MQELNRSVVAKLLATENISVVQDNVRTASFDVKNRILTLPLWSDTTRETEDHLIGHEVGHALFTPLDGWHDAVCDNGKAYKSYLNVIEDARIEKLVQRKYPGLRRSFIASYKKMLADGFFGSPKDLNDMNLIDRLNVYFKCGLTVGIKFTEEERHWIPRIEKLEKWEEVVALVDELYNGVKEKEEEEQELEALAEESMEGEDDAEGFEDDEYFESEDDEGAEGEATVVPLLPAGW